MPQSVYFKTNVDTRVLKNLTKAMTVAPVEFPKIVASAASMHVAFTMEQLPAEVQGKTHVEVIPDGGGGILITYESKGGEASDIALTPSNKSIFVPEENLGEFSAANRSFTRQGDIGRFFSKVQITGRPSIDSYLMANLLWASKEATQKVRTELDDVLRNELKSTFAKYNIHYNPGLGRYQAGAGGAYLPHTGAFYPGGQIVLGDF